MYSLSATIHYSVSTHVDTDTVNKSLTVYADSGFRVYGWMRLITIFAYPLYIVYIFYLINSPRQRCFGLGICFI
jgi:hypothetical protein